MCTYISLDVAVWMVAYGVRLCAGCMRMCRRGSCAIDSCLFLMCLTYITYMVRAGYLSNSNGMWYQGVW